MRQIKFRVWDTESKQFLEEIPRYEEWLDAWIRDGDGASFDDCVDDPFININPETFNGRLIYQQWTGLTDKDGKEIYDGDIVQYLDSLDEETWSKEVVFDKGYFGLSRGKNVSPTYLFGYINICKVIGHIYDEQNH